MKPKPLCELCGKPVRSDYAFKQRKAGTGYRCKDCVLKERAKIRSDRSEKKKQIYEAKHCVVCGNHLIWKPSFINRSFDHLPTTCSVECWRKASTAHRKANKEEVENTLCAYIRNKGEYTSYFEAARGCGYSNSTLKKLGISIRELNKRVLGIPTSDVDVIKLTKADIQVLTLEELREAYSVPGDTYAELVRAYMQTSRKHYITATHSFLVDVVLSCISSEDRYIGVVRLCELLHVGRVLLVKKYSIDVPYLNKLMGKVQTSGTSYFEDMAHTLLVRHLGVCNISRHHVFSDCRSLCGYPLEFDFYIPGANVLVEVDGEQHKGAKGACNYNNFNRQNDKIKDCYAANNGLTLIRVDTAPSHTFVNRFTTTVLGILKPIELLETRPENAEGNQQPSPDTREGSETIEKHTDTASV